jgi:succinate dehydrogenase / fumarate reductase membrane anchor subunit
MSLRTPIGRARGLGSAKEGVNHWWMQRLTAVALVPLTLWFVASLMVVARADYAQVVEWVRQPLNTAVLVALLIAVFYHAVLGLQVVLEDYIHNEGSKIIYLVVMKLAMALLGVTAVFSVLRIAFGG